MHTHARVSSDISTTSRVEKAKLDHGRIGPRISRSFFPRSLARNAHFVKDYYRQRNRDRYIYIIFGGENEKEKAKDERRGSGGRNESNVLDDIYFVRRSGARTMLHLFHADRSLKR